MFYSKALNIKLKSCLFVSLLGLALNVQALNLTALGDSLTQGLKRDAFGNVSGVTSIQNGSANVGGYEPYLKTKLDTGIEPSTVYNWGHGGDNSAGGVNRINSVLNSSLSSDFILIMYGANDLYQGISSSGTKANIGFMVDSSRAKGVTPIISEITLNTTSSCIGFSNNACNPPIRLDYNPKIYQLANEKNVPIALNYVALDGPNWYAVPYHSGDELHLSNAGYERVAQAWFDVIKNNFFPGTGIFKDVPDNYFGKDAIEKIYIAGVTGGCSTNPLLYCYNSSVTRDQMAVFVGRAKHGPSFIPSSPIGLYSDVPVTYWAASWIEQFANDGITKGCGGGKFCPTTGVTRAQMAVFLERATRGSNFVPPPAIGQFNDVPISNPFAPWIEQLAKDNITGGCGGGNYCPNKIVNRGEMAVFLVRAFNL